MGCGVSAGSNAVLIAFLSAGAALVVVLSGLAVALVFYQRRFVAMHRAHAEGLMKAQEQERAWVAQEVHDDALQRIMLLLHELDDWAGQADAGPGSERVAALRAELEDLSLVLRRMAYRLHPAFVAQEGIVAMLERLGADVQRAAGVEVQVHDAARPVPSLTADQSLTVYRIAQEALANVVRHAASPRAVVEVSRHNGTMEMSIQDFGRGFDVAQAAGTGLGLMSMTERARSAGGMLSVASHPGGGTRVQLRLPVVDPA